MNRTAAWIVAGLLAAGVFGFGLAEALAQRDPPRPPAGFVFGIGRFQFVKAEAADFILLDTATGDLYRAKEKDVKPYSERPKPEMIRPLPGEDLRPRERGEADRPKDARREPEAVKPAERKDVRPFADKAP